MSIAQPEADSRFQTEFLDDYFAECEEHLTVVRRNLLALESSVNMPRIDRSAVDQLLRSFHSLKGISGMVGVREAEQLAHQMESYLRALRNDQTSLTIEGLDALVAGTKIIEQVIAECRAGIATTDISGILDRLERIVPATATDSSGDGGQPVEVADPSPQSPQSTNADEDAQVAAAITRGQKIWRFEFTPVQELAERGVNVSAIRSRLQELGELISASPRLMPKGGIVFEFVVASGAPEATLEAKFEQWAADGLTYAPYDGPPPPDASAQLDAPGATITAASPTPDPAAGRSDGKTAGPSTESLGPMPFTPSNVVRVDLSRLDDLMRMVGDLVISRSRLDGNLKDVEPDLPPPQWRPLQEANLAMERQLRDLREGMMRVRMVPVGEIFERMHFVVRDLAREYGKKIKLELVGQQTEIDKLVVERMMDPILHLVRNAVSHGLETENERISIGKPPEGRLSLRAHAAAELVVIEIEDDGRGINTEEVARRARALGLIGPDAEVDNATLLDLICAPGFSTRDQADRTSGRGVGMNVVKNAIMGLAGSFEVNTEAGRGTRFTIQLPLTLAIADALIVSAGGQRFAVPQSSVREVIEVETSTIKALENNEIILHRGGALPLLRLAKLFRLEQKAEGRLHAFVVGSGSASVGIAVDRIIGQREVVVRAISDPLIQVPGIAGATELGDGRVVLILDALTLARAVRRTQGGPAATFRLPRAL